MVLFPGNITEDAAVPSFDLRSWEAGLKALQTFTDTDARGILWGHYIKVKFLYLADNKIAVKIVFDSGSIQ